LANLEGLYTTLEDKIAAVQMLFDVRSAPADVLAWLASWFGIAFDPSWDEARQRMFIKHAMFFFQYRGTLLGLEMALSLALDECVDDSVFTEQPQARRLRLRGVRIIEKFRARPVSRPLAETVVTTGPRLLTSAAARTPLARATTGANQQLAATLQQFSLPARGGAFIPLGQTALKQSSVWRQLTQTQLGFVPTASEADLPAWQNFLARRYQRIGALNQTYQMHYASFDDVPLPTELPQGGPLLQDWYDFETVVLAMQRTAHRFTVLLPMTGTISFNTDEQQRRLDLTTRIINLEKPAHTIFDVKLYWAMFRIGEARLGQDTLLDLGSRAPLLMPPMVLGQEHLVESYLAPAYPQNVSDRFVIGRGPQSGRKCN
jgi:phage tail-like protein